MIGYNERSWAIDVISEINLWASGKSLNIKHAGGESSLKTESTTLFPDILLFEDVNSSLILQGWEMKFPDTPIDNAELIENAAIKANTIGANSFLLWNVTTAVLYIKNDADEFEPHYIWRDLNHIRRRDQVNDAKHEWKSLLHKILNDINYFFGEGKIKSTTVIEAVTGEGISNLILDYSTFVADNLKLEAQTNGDLNDAVRVWWRGIKQEYLDYNAPWVPLAKIILTTWTNKLVFAHTLKQYHEKANDINNITEETSIIEAIEIIKGISDECDYWNIFQPHIGEQFIGETIWRRLIKFNEFLIDLRLEGIDASLIQKILENTVYRSQRRVAGQFSTPKPLAALLASLTVTNKRGNVLDPCCGTGTIARAVYDLKVNSGMSTAESIQSTWASDKFSFPVQMATLALASPENRNEIIKVFRSDAIDLTPNKSIQFYNPNDGSPINLGLASMDSIVSNLPFVQQEDLKVLNPTIIHDINDLISDIAEETLALDPRSDLYAYLPFSLWSLLTDGGKLGLIISNSWLSTKWGNKFRQVIHRFFTIETVVTSGNRRWFGNAEVVTSILVLKKRTAIDVRENTIDENEKSSFVVLNEEINSFLDDQQNVNFDLINELSSLIRTRDIESPYYDLAEYTPNQIADLNELGLGWNSFFSSCNWLMEIKEKLVKASSLFEVKRGERRGWDALFYPSEENEIEAEYIQPVLKNSKEISRLVTVASEEAFCCVESIDELKESNKIGALKWIERFEDGVNGTGLPLSEVLARSNMHWYSMSPSTMADMVIGLNPFHRLFVAKLEERSFVNQRLIRFTKKRQETDIDLCHALMNSVLGLFYIEALGFGRGLGALDLSATTMKQSLYMLNPSLLTQEQIANIKEKFNILKQRDILKIKEELTNSDREEFDLAVLSAYGIEEQYDNIKNSLLKMYDIRVSVIE